MAFYIAIKKKSESMDHVIYEYSDSNSSPGMLKLDKASGEVSEVAPAAGDESGRRFQRAAMKVMQHWKAGDLPEETCWAS